MIRNYLKTAWRNLFKNKAFSAINILGLSLGMACSLLIMLWVWDEKGMDTFHTNDSQLYIVYEKQYHDGQIDGGYYTPGLLADELKQIYPEIKYSTMMAWNELNTFEANQKILKETGDFGSPDFFSVFSFPLISGTAENALKTTTDIAISRKMAEDFFGSAEAAFGQAIRYQNRKDLKISAVFENLPANSSMKFDYLINWETFLEENSWAKEWGNNGPPTFLVFHEGTDVAAFENKFQDFLEKRHPEDQSKNFVIKFALQRYSEKYLNSNIKNGEIVGGRIQYVNLFSIIAVFIVLIACINFMNLTTARSIKRGKEIGVRKVVGAIRGALIRQFIGEAVLTVLLAFVFGLLLVALILPPFNTITQKQITLPIDEPLFWLTISIVAIFIGFISGSYPALYLSGFNPVRAIKGALKFSSGALWFRKGLVVFQFALSIMLIIGTIIISKQVSYVQSVNLGYERENLVYIPLEGTLPGKYKVFKDEAMKVPGIKFMSRASQEFTSIGNGTGGVVWEGKDPNAVLQFTQAAIGYDFIKAMDMQLLQGREFSPDFVSDSVGYIVNEAALKLFNYKEPIGMPLTFWQKKGTIVGVVKDFHFQSLHNNIKPMVLRLGEHLDWGVAVIRLESGKTKEALAGLEKIYKELNPQFPFTYKFSDEEYNKMYVSEQIVDKLSNAFAALAIFISCLGLLGLTMFTVEQRTKEIGIRKVLGAPMVSLFGLLSKELFVLVSLAIVIASPLAWYVMTDWLKGYAYRIDITAWIFLLAGATAILIALVTISFQTIRALLTNPVNSLRSE